MRAGLRNDKVNEALGAAMVVENDLEDFAVVRVRSHFVVHTHSVHS